MALPPGDINSLGSNITTPTQREQDDNTLVHVGLDSLDSSRTTPAESAQDASARVHSDLEFLVHICFHTLDLTTTTPVESELDDSPRVHADLENRDSKMAIPVENDNDDSAFVHAGLEKLDSRTTSPVEGDKDDSALIHHQQPDCNKENKEPTTTPPFSGSHADSESLNSKTTPSVETEQDDSTLVHPQADFKNAEVSYKECTICLNDVASDLFPQYLHAQGDSEQHDSDVCLKCYNEHIEAEINNKGPERISCPQCPQLLAEPEIRKLTQHGETYQKYIDRAAKKCMQQEEEFHACPNAACPWGAFFAKDDGNIFNCQLCKARYCLSCEVPFHEGQLCEEYLRAGNQQATQETDEQKSIEAVSEISKKCPSPPCGMNIEKVDGCDHITCDVCKHEFCWLCFAPYAGPTGIRTIGNSAHQASCQYAPRNLPDTDVDPETEEDPDVVFEHRLRREQERTLQLRARRDARARARALDQDRARDARAGID